MARIAAVIPAFLLCRFLSTWSIVGECQTKQPVIPTNGIQLPNELSTQYLNPTFRYQTAGIDLVSNPEFPVWTLPFSLDWREAGVLPSVGDQGLCAASWAITATAALDAAQAIGQGTAQAARVSVQQVLDCAGGNATCVAGGWPPDAFVYAAELAANASSRFFNDSEYPYAGEANHTHQCQDGGQLAVSTTSYEAVALSGPRGLLLAVQNQPVVAFVAADQPSFQAYDGTSVYANMSCFDSGVVNHAVLIVGYNLSAPTPYWILQNSWGILWGANGYMKMAITGGDGICGINNSPGYYPVVQGRTACGPPNPCGGGLCIPSSESSGPLNYCVCPEGTVPSTNIDGSSSCIIADVCSTLGANPCGFGTCVSDQLGNYTCICPPGSTQGTYAYNGSPTCSSPGPASLDPTFVAAGGESCYLVAVTYGLTESELEAQNPELNCSEKLPAGATVNVTTPSYTGCSTFYPVDSSGLDTCGSIAQAAGLSLQELAAANRGLDCNRLLPGMQICIVSDAFLSTPLCTLYEAVGANDTCAALAASSNLSLPELYRLNPGVYCRHLSPHVSSADQRQTLLAIPGTQLCVDGTAASFPCRRRQPGGCLTFFCDTNVNHVYHVPARTSCATVLNHQFCSALAIFQSLNRGILCGGFLTGQPVCAPEKRSVPVCPVPRPFSSL